MLYVLFNSIIDMNFSLMLVVFGGSEVNLCVGLEILFGVFNVSSCQGLNVELICYIFSLMVFECKFFLVKGVFDILGNWINGL